MKKSLRFEEVLAAMPEPTARLLDRAAQISLDSGHVLHLVGGPVRDLVLADRSSMSM